MSNSNNTSNIDSFDSSSSNKPFDTDDVSLYIDGTNDMLVDNDNNINELDNQEASSTTDAFCESVDSDFQVVGLMSSTNGRTCSRHSCCGESLKIGDLFRLVKCVVAIKKTGEEDIIEEGIKAVKIEDSTESCTVGFVPRAHMNLPVITKNISKFCIVSELYSISENKYKRLASLRNCGIAGANALDEIPRQE